MKPRRYPAERPLRLRLLNWYGRALGLAGLSPSKRSAESMMAAAIRLAGASEWGDDHFREGLHVLLESLREDTKLSYVGWSIIQGTIMRCLVNRLEISQELKRSPEALEEKIRRPLFVTGLPRSGTTMLQALLSMDPRSRYLRAWEARHPVPLPEEEAGDDDPRIAEAERNIREIRRLAPGLDAIHHTEARGPAECRWLLINTLTYPAFSIYAHVPRYREWLDGQDMTPIYAYHRLQLQLLQSRFRRERWLLKAPLHLHYLDTLMEVFPDACVVQTHRDPLKAIPSLCSLMATFWSVTRTRVRPGRMGYRCMTEMASVVERASKARESLNCQQFLDVRYQDLVGDPVGTVRGIYQHFGYDYSDVFEARMRQWLADNPQGKHGSHRYSLEQFGLEREQIIERFATYCERYGVSSG